ncbi:MAG: hypothetical protein ACREI7_08180, partial [Myxococcota bacterium]
MNEGPTGSVTPRIASLCVHGAALGAAGLMLAVAGEPIFTDDAWWHLALGRFFRAAGPWLENDPLLFAAVAPAPRSSWLWDVALAEVLAATGFVGLRALHVALVTVILALCWSLLRRASGSAAAASLGTIAFIALAAYRLFQLRPDLFSMLALMTTYRLLVEHRKAPSARQIALAAALTALWANVHALFPLVLGLIGAATAGVAVSAALGAA